MGRRGRPRHPDILTPREWEVLELLRQHLSNEQIAERIGVTLDGAKYHVSQILSKLGVASRQEAASVAPAERRRWWVRWPLWAKISGVMTAVALAGGLAVLAWAAIQTGGESEEIVGQEASSAATQPRPTPTSVATAPAVPTLVAPFGPNTIGSYDDIHDFRSFAAQIDAAVRGGDVQFFLDNTRFQDFHCDQAGFPARPRACGRSFNPDVITAVVIGVISSEGYGADREEYGQFLRGFLNNSPEESDPYGGARVLLYSYGVRTQRSGGPSPGEDRVDAVITAISVQGPSGIVFDSPRRALLELHSAFNGEKWLIDWLSYGGDPYTAAIDLDPGGAGADVATGGPPWHFWQRWKPVSTP
ncbi:MAG: hypothetical protein DMG22_21890 [Acidobacteria bacterium]|nr:MAG: hypothetical protein DMG22_21890 [Acidobacteriota bacterium]